MKKFIEKIKVIVKDLLYKLSRRIYLPFLIFLRHVYLPGFRGVSLYYVGLFFVRGMSKSSVWLRANAISYSFIIAFVPAVLFLFTLIPYIPIAGLKENLMLTLEEVIPHDAFVLLRSTIEDIVTNQQTGLLSISFLISLFFASSGVIAIMNAFDSTFHAIDSRNLVKTQLISLVLVFILALNMIISGVALAASTVIIYFMEGHGIIGNSLTLFLLELGQWVIILLTSLIAFSSIYYLAPAKKRIFPFFSAGSILASFLSVISFKLFTIFIEDITNYNKFYGSLGAMIMIIVWINLTALMILIGFELNASIYEAKKNSEKNVLKNNPE